MNKMLTTIQQQEHLLAVHAGRIHQARDDVKSMETASEPKGPGSNFLVYIFTFLVILAAYLFDLILLRPVVEYLASLANRSLASIAIYLVPLILILFEIYLSLTRSRLCFEKKHPRMDIGEDEHPVFTSLPLWLVNLICVLVLTIQPYAAFASYNALAAVNPTMTSANICLLGFLLIFATCSHLIVLTSGDHLFSWYEHSNCKRRVASLRKKRQELARLQSQFVLQFNNYFNLTTAYNNQNPPTPYIIQLDTATLVELQPLIPTAQFDRISNPYTA